MTETQTIDTTTSGARQALDQAMKAHFSGDLPSAEMHYRTVVDYGYRLADVLPLVAQVAALRGDPVAALEFWERLFAFDPDHVVGLMEAGTLNYRLRRYDQAVRQFETVAARHPGHVLALNNLAIALLDSGRQDRALAVFRDLAVLEPGNPLRYHQIRRTASAIVPFWHIPMLNDQPRNEAFQTAIERAIAVKGKGALVLDIGAGSGLLSMMAARAGAETITTCEMVPVIAEAAAEIVRANGFGDRITVVGKSSADLIVGEDMAERADILISEILSSDLLAEHVLPTFEDARRRLLRDDAIIIPARVSAMGCLVESAVLERYSQVGHVSGFDVSAFNALAPQRLPVHGKMTAWRRLSADTALLTLDLTSGDNLPGTTILSIEAQEDGDAVGILQWMKVELSPGCDFSNHPDGYSEGGWLQILHPFERTRRVRKGERVEIAAGHDRSSLILVPVERTGG